MKYHLIKPESPNLLVNSDAYVHTVIYSYSLCCPKEDHPKDVVKHTLPKIKTHLVIMDPCSNKTPGSLKKGKTKGCRVGCQAIGRAGVMQGVGVGAKAVKCSRLYAIKI